MSKLNYYLKLLKEKDLYTYYHSLRVSKYALFIGIRLNYNNKELNTLKITSLLHDIGKLYISDSILKKQDKLTKEEYKIIQNHLVYAKKILDNNYNDVINDIMSHHERLDGSGYPNHKKNISINAQIISIVDSFDAMTTDRGYNEIKSYEEAFLELFKCSKVGIFNKYLVKLFYEEFCYRFHTKTKIKHY